MDALRVSLIVIGLIVIAAVYVATRYWRERKERAREEWAALAPQPGDTDGRRRTPSPAADFEDDIEQLAELVAEQRPAGGTQRTGAAAEETSAPGGDEELILVLYILARPGRVFSGSALLEAVSAAGMVYGEMNIFHRYAGPQPGKGGSVFSLVDALEPGTFDLDAMDDFSTAGVTLFMRLPGPVEGREAFEQMLAAARRIAEMLGGELRDETRSMLTPQTVSHLKERVEAFRFKLQMARIRQRRQ